MTLKKALVLLSGGIDSAVALDWARERWRVTAITFDGEGRPRGESHACRAVARWAGVELLRVPAPYLRARRSGYVPGRNLALHAISMAVAEERRTEIVVAGHNRSDGALFEDARPGFFRRLERLSGGVRIALPFARLTDAQVIARGLLRHVPLRLTWSCYRDGPRPCRRCGACRGRIESFRQTGSEDFS
jgi:7-cyano-7-deazaguanine synthase